MHVTMAREVLGHSRRQTKASFHLRRSSQALSKILAPIVNIAITDHHTRKCLLPNISLPTIPNNSTMYENNHFFLSKVKGQVKARFIGKLTKDEKKKLPKQLWVFKALVTHVQGPKLGWVPKTKT
jgi:hypothetical protein